MAFTGRDYHAAFEEACATLPLEREEDGVRSRLEGLEWVLWEAIRGVFLIAAVIIGAVAVLPVRLAIGERENWISNAICLAAALVVAFAAYWMFRLIFHVEVSAHVKGRKFGSGGLG